MNFLDILGGLIRRWYITVPGVVLAAVLGIGAWVMVPPDQERTASLLLLPGVGSLPVESANPYLYLGGLTTAADVLTRAAGAESALEPLLEDHPDASVEIQRDGTTAGPVLLITVTAPLDEEAGEVLDAVLVQTVDLLAQMQEEERIVPGNRMTASVLAKDESGTPQQRTRLLLTGGITLGVLVLTVVLTAVVDGLARGRSRDRGRGGPGGAPLPDAAGGPARQRATADDEDDPARTDDLDDEPAPAEAEPEPEPAAEPEPVPVTKADPSETETDTPPVPAEPSGESAVPAAGARGGGRAPRRPRTPKVQAGVRR